MLQQAKPPHSKLSVWLSPDGGDTGNQAERAVPFADRIVSAHPFNMQAELFVASAVGSSSGAQCALHSGLQDLADQMEKDCCYYEATLPLHMMMEVSS